jgi:periplasmic protein TonB
LRPDLQRPESVGRIHLSGRSRATSLALAIGASLILMIALVSFNVPRPQRSQSSRGAIVLDLSSDARTAPAAVNKRTESRPRPAPPVPIPPAAPRPMPTKNPLPLLVLSKEELAAADIAKLGTNRSVGQEQQVASAAGDSQRVGTAPDGKPLYNAEWYRPPTDAELSGYLPANMPNEGWGLVACKTAARYRVEDCVELGNSPPGSRLASAVRQAAWQFLVRPPRIGGKELVGTWVRIRIDYVPAGRD